MDRVYVLCVLSVFCGSGLKFVRFVSLVGSEFFVRRGFRSAVCSVRYASSARGIRSRFGVFFVRGSFGAIGGSAFGVGRGRRRRFKFLGSAGVRGSFSF